MTEPDTTETIADMFCLDRKPIEGFLCSLPKDHDGDEHQVWKGEPAELVDSWPRQEHS